jgi:Ca2+-binding EF-hand superfamily protein
VAALGKYSLLIAVVLSGVLAMGQDDRGGRGDFRRGEGGGRGEGGRGDGGGRFRGNRGPLTPEMMSRFTSMMEERLKALDTNHNGMLDAEEVNALPQDMRRMAEGMMRRAGIEPKFPIAISDIKQAMEKSMRDRMARDQANSSSNGAPNGPPGNGGRSSYFGSAAGDPPKPPHGRGPSPSASATDPSKPLAKPDTAASRPSANTAAGSSSPAKADAAAASSADAKKLVRKSSRVPTGQERLSGSGLPKWFLEADADGDGQVTMAEYAKEWTPELLDKFNRYDLNRDGVITAAECLKVEKRTSPSGK